jgi:hypothetical protein
MINGCIPDKIDKRDKVYEAIAGYNPTDVDFDTGFDIRQYIGTDIRIKNQRRTYACVGFAWSYYAWVLNTVERLQRQGVKVDPLEISAKAFYSQISLGYMKGAYLRDGAKLLVNYGALTEKEVPTYNGNSIDEDWVINKDWKTPEKDELAKRLKAKEYRVIESSINIDVMAKAIQDNYGVVSGCNGDNNGRWRTEEPKAPVSSNVWGHALYFGAYGIKNGRKFVATPNSWGDLLDTKWDGTVGSGWQKFYEDEWFNVKPKVINGYNAIIPNMFNAWTITDKPNIKYTDDELIELVGNNKDCTNSDLINLFAYSLKTPTQEDWNKFYKTKYGKDCPVFTSQLTMDETLIKYNIIV